MYYQTYLSCSTDGDCYFGMCKNGPGGTPIGCAGTCMANLSEGGNCRNGALNIKFNVESGDDDACLSGHCVCCRCASSASKRANGRR